MPAPQRHYLLYARQVLRDLRVIIAVLVVGYLLFAVYQGISTRSAAAFATGAAFAVMPLLLGLAVYAYSKRNYVEFGDGGVSVRQFLRRATIAYTDIERVRVDSLEHIFDRPDRKRWQTKTVKNLYGDRAICLRLRAVDDLPEQLRHKLGPRTILEREAVLPVTDTDAALATLKQRMSARRQQPEAPTDPTRRRRGKRGR
ncbi:MAG TPA: hypothetical protein VGR61_08670 [Candidatus Dormibacteraeota bacterium]|nr:hypothetical protein [Candidatus Dormibacteraeota bacterium]